MTSVSSRAAAGAIFALLPGMLIAQSDSVAMDELQKCRELEDPAQRMACYDGIGEAAATTPAVAAPVEAVSQPAAEPTPAAAIEEVPQAVPKAPTAEIPAAAASEKEYRELTDDVGLPKSDDNLQTIRATVVRCGEANNRRFYFYFDNGQVWKYLGRKKLRFLDCDNQASLVEDGWGFVLKLDGDDREMRVQRVK